MSNNISFDEIIRSQENKSLSEEELNNTDKGIKERILIEDGTMSAFGFTNPAEVEVHR